MKRIFIFSFILISNTIYCQTKLSYAETEELANDFYQMKNYKQATSYYLSLVELTDFKSRKSLLLYNIACCLSLQGKKDSAIYFLKEAIRIGFNDKFHLLKDEDLSILYEHPDWKAIIKDIKDPKETLNENPQKVKFITEDIDRFWAAYEQALKDTLHYKDIFKEKYFSKSSKGMDDYMSLKVSSIDFFIKHIKSAPKFYSAIKGNTLQLENFKEKILDSFFKLKSLYKPSKFPDIYFVIGAFTSAGTVSDAGLLIGLNQICQTGHIPIYELGFRLKTRIAKFEHLPNIIAHELIHFQQNGMRNDTTTLSYVVKEGMADFLGELISGGTPNPALYEWAKGKEKIIWEKFKTDMYYDRYSNWLANSKDATPYNLPDQGYWVGYQICKAFYENSPDKAKAIVEMLSISDYKDFLVRSKWESRIENSK